jgi:hypothetical protein
MATAEKITLQAFASTNLAALGYNAEKKILAVQFKSGAIYHYADIPLKLALGFLQTDSVGRYYATQIKGKYPGQRMTGPCPACGSEGWIGDRCEDCGTADYQEKPYDPPEANGTAQPVPEQDQPQNHVPQQRRCAGARKAPQAAGGAERRPASD